MRTLLVQSPICERRAFADRTCEHPTSRRSRLISRSGRTVRSSLRSLDDALARLFTTRRVATPLLDLKYIRLVSPSVLERPKDFGKREWDMGNRDGGNGNGEWGMG